MIQSKSFLKIGICLVFFALSKMNVANAQSSVIINTGVAGAPAYNAGPIYRSTAASAYDASRYVYLYTASELAAAGILPWSVIQLVGWTKNNNVTTTGPAIFRIYMRNTNASSFTGTSPWTALNSGASLVYENLAQTIDSFVSPTYIDFPLDTAFLYNGGSLEIATEWDINAVAGNPTTGTFNWLWSTVPDCVYGTGNTTLAPITNLSSTSNSISTLDDRRPFIKIDFTPGITGIKENRKHNFVISPNPASDNIVVSFPNASFAKEMSLINYCGQKIYTVSLSKNELKNDFSIDVAALPKGIYILQVLFEEGLQSRKVILK